MRKRCAKLSALGQYGTGELGRALLKSEYYAVTQIARFLPDATPTQK